MESVADPPWCDVMPLWYSRAVYIVECPTTALRAFFYRGESSLDTGMKGRGLFVVVD